MDTRRLLFASLATTFLLLASPAVADGVGKFEVKGTVTSHRSYHLRDGTLVVELHGFEGKINGAGAHGDLTLFIRQGGGGGNPDTGAYSYKGEGSWTLR